MISKQTILAKLPPFQNKWVTVVSGNQSTEQLVENVIDAHGRHAAFYDQFAGMFDNGKDVQDILTDLHFFVKKNIAYKEEPGKRQTDSLPTGLLTRGYGDCKHYAGFIGGVLDALKRKGRKIDWQYRFASYYPDKPAPHHVFIVVNHKGTEYWVDPVPGAFSGWPHWQLDIKP